jgi:hypothetical protein
VSVRGKPELKYFGVNVLDVVPALDLERSEYQKLPGSNAIDRILRFILRRIPDDAPPIFHVAERPSMVMVNDDLRRRLAAASKHPGVLTPAEKYTNKH